MNLLEDATTRIEFVKLDDLLGETEVSIKPESYATISEVDEVTEVLKISLMQF